MSPKVPVNLPITLVKATRAESDEAQLMVRQMTMNSPPPTFGPPWKELGRPR